jgi:hypothetical protein
LQAILPTLQQSLAARLDRLGEARDVAQKRRLGDFPPFEATWIL